MPFEWKCRYCGHDQEVSDQNYNEAVAEIHNANSKHGAIFGVVLTIACSNQDCQELALVFSLHHRIGQNQAIIREDNRQPIQFWRLFLESIAKQQPDYIPETIVDNYKQACRIRDLSPNASITMSRRCLQGMIRDFWDVKEERNLSDEIEAIKDRVQPATLEAIDAARKMGNIGAHMEKDVNLILDFEPKEAQVLIKLIEMLFKDWYVNRHEQQKQLAAVVDLSKSKEKQKNATANKS